MAATLTITSVAGSFGTVTISIPKGLQQLETSGGWSAADAAIRNIFRSGGFWNSAGTIFYPASQIASIATQ